MNNMILVNAEEYAALIYDKEWCKLKLMIEGGDISDCDWYDKEEIRLENRNKFIKNKIEELKNGQKHNITKSIRSSTSTSI